MFTVYEVQAWLVGLPWVLLGVATIAYLVEQNLFKRMQKVCEDAIEGLEKTSARLFESETRNVELEAGMTRANENRFKAEADARESCAAHQACARKLEAEKAEVVKWKGLAEIWQGKAAKLHQKRGKDGKFSPKKKVK